MSEDLEGAEAIDRMWTALRNAVPDTKERVAFALYWIDTWGTHFNEGQTDGRVKWWQTHVHDDDVEHSTDDGLFVTRGRNRYRRMAEAAIAMAS